MTGPQTGESSWSKLFLLTANQGLAFHPGGEEDGVGCKFLVAPEVAHQDLQSVGFSARRRGQPTNVPVVPNTAVREGEKTLF